MPGEGELPDCDDHNGSRTMGSCTHSSNPGDTCTENSKATKHTVTFDYVGPTLLEIAVCAGKLAICIAACGGDSLCIDNCGLEYGNCLLEYCHCEEISNEYLEYQTGCVD